MPQDDEKQVCAGAKERRECGQFQVSIVVLICDGGADIALTLLCVTDEVSMHLHLHLRLAVRKEWRAQANAR
jgi:hypothetical protein